MAVPIVATVVALCVLRWWPYLLVGAGLLAVPGLLATSVGVSHPLAVSVVTSAGYPLAIVGVLACAQGLVGTSPGWGAAVAGLSVGAQLFGPVLTGPGWLARNDSIPAWHLGLLVAAFLSLLPVAWRTRRGDPAAIGLTDVGRWSWRRVRLALAAALAMALVIPLSLLTTERLAALLGVSFSAVYRHGYAEVAIHGAITLVAATAIATVAGVWSLAGALTTATVRVAVVAPMILALTALTFQGPVRLLGALAGVLLGAVAAGSRWRVPLAAALTGVAATALFIAHGATTGQPEKLAEQRHVIPALLILVLVTAASTAVVGATAPVLAPRGAVPAMVGPVATVLAAGGAQTVAVTYLRNGLPESSYLNPVQHLTTSALLLLVAGAATGGLGFAHHIAARRAERKQAEQIRREAAAAERDRLARPIHDGVLQVLTLVQRHGAELGGDGARLATLAAEQEVALRSLLTGSAGERSTAERHGGARQPSGGSRQDDLRAALTALESPVVEVAAPADPVPLPAATAAELTAAVQAALDNVRRHAGPDSRAWVLLEDEGDAVRVTVRDDGIGFPPERLAEAADAGRLGIAQSMRGRIADLGGTTSIDSRPGAGTEVEFLVPRGRTT